MQTAQSLLQPVQLTADANATYTITPNAWITAVANVVVDGISVGAVGTYTFTNVTASHTISATFVLNATLYNHSNSAGANGSITPNGITVHSIAEANQYIYNHCQLHVII